MSVSRFGRAQQWMQFHRQWHVIDASRQDVFKLGERVGYYLTGNWKPICHPETDCGDNVVVVNCKDVAMQGFSWKRISYYFDKGYPRSKVDIPAHQIHEYDPCRIMFMAVNSGMSSKLFRRLHLQRLHLFADEEMPDFIRRNISNQLEQVQTVPRKSDEYTPEERANFPRLVEYKDEHLLDWNNPQPTIETYIERRSR